MSTKLRGRFWASFLSSWEKKAFLLLGLFLTPEAAGGSSTFFLARGAEPFNFCSSGEESKGDGIARSISNSRAHHMNGYYMVARRDSARDEIRTLPDLVDPGWQLLHGDRDPSSSVLDGRDSMPTMRTKLRRDDVKKILWLVQDSQGGESQTLRERAMENSGRARAPVVARAAKRTSEPVDRATSWPGVNTPDRGRGLFLRFCVSCHGADGSSRPVRSRVPWAPDFTSTDWQGNIDEHKMKFAILEGYGTQMPAFDTRLSEPQVGDLVAFVRTFAPTRRKSGQGEQEGPDLVSFNERFLRFQEELNDLQRQYRELSDVPPGKALSESSGSRQHEPSPQLPRGVPATPAIVELFQKRCVKCHGADGTGNEARDRMAEIPDFTDASWHARRSDPQLLASILNGKGDDMPPVRGKISEEQARGLVAYLRTFAPTMDKSTQEEQEEAATVGSAGIKPPRGFFKKLIRWFGKFHPPSVHFPIALLTAAVVAEFLRIRTGKPAFDVILRYCLWFGTITALVSGVLGWFLGGFRLTDPSWVMLTHRWLGTSTVVCAVLVLMLCEVRCRLEHRQTGLWFRVPLIALAVLVSATGFFGGAMVFGLNHYNWPP